LDKCAGYYELQPNESPNDLSDKCECGGNLKHRQNLDDADDSQKTCSNCGSIIEDDKKVCPGCGFKLKEPPLTKGKFQSKYPRGDKEFNVNWLAMSIAFVVALYIIFFVQKKLFYEGFYIGPLIGGFITGCIVGKSSTNGILNGGIPTGITGFIGILLLVLVFGKGSPDLSSISPGMLITASVIWAIVFFIVFFIIGSIGGLLGATLRKIVSS
jgi:hypothetical protein